MASPGASRPLSLPLIERLVQRVRGARAWVQALAFVAVVAIVALVAAGIGHGHRFAVWAPIDVIASHDPLQELPIRLARGGGALPPARSYDASLDLSSIKSLVVGVDLHRIPKGASRYEVAIHSDDGKERFRDAIPPRYFEEGRFMLRLYSARLHPGDYLLEIESFEGAGDGRVVAASWFQVTK
jgi:hypothetical protein